MKPTGWIYLRIVFGIAQMAGSFAALLLWFQDGLVPAVWWLAFGTGAVTLVSVLLFRVLHVDK